MQFVHRLEPERLGLIEEQPPAVVLRWDDSSGTRRKKTFRKKTAYGALDAARVAALRFLFSEGFVLPAPGDGAIRWLGRSDEQYPHGHPFAIGEAGIWLGDTGAIERVTPRTCARETWPIGEQIMPRSVGFGGGALIASLDVRQGAIAAGAPYAKPTRDQLAYGVIAIRDGVIEGVAEVPHTPESHIFDGVSVARDGRFLGPSPKGAGLYVDGVETQSWPVRRAQYYAPKAALSPNGAWIALLVEGGAIRIEGPRSRVIPAGFTQVLNLSIDDAGIAWAGALGADFWGTYRLDERAERVCEPTDATPAPDGESVVIVQYGSVTQQSLSGAPIRAGELPWLGMAKGGRARFVDADTVIVRTDAHTLAEVDLSALSPA